jgi:hypothetical protein
VADGWQQIFYLPPLEGPLYTGISKEVVAVADISPTFSLRFGAQTDCMPDIDFILSESIL